jgi:6-phosphogluconolactonase
LGSPRIFVSETPELLATRAADEFVAACAAAITDRGRFAVALSGGKTPRAMLEALAARPVDWLLVHFFWSDERCVGPDDPNSNYRMAREALLSRVTPPQANVHRIKGELDPPEGARDYTEQLQSFFSGTPSFDLVYLGLGPDGHTASLFPGTTALRVTDKPCVANRVDRAVGSVWRLTLTFPAINAARRVIFLVEGSEKAAILKRVIEGAKDVERYPAQGIAPASGDLLWLADAPADALLESTK